MDNVTLGFEGLGWLAWGVSLVGVGVLAWGVLIGLVELVRLEIHRLHGREIAHERALVRQDLGYYILLGLEFLIAADIIRTILHPGLEELAILGAIVAIRTVISYFLTREMQEAGRLEKLGASRAASDTTD
ncbi:MAG: DUF1622 domain-containing protein [Armatimonadota bacterium]